MAIGTAAAIIGSAVIGAGASAAVSSSAAKKAANASNYAADQNAQVNREIYNQTRADLSPYNQAGQAGLAALMQRLGLSPTSAPAQQPQPATQAQASGNPGPGNARATGGPAGTSPLEGQVGGSRPSVIAAQGFGGNPNPTMMPQAQPDYAAYGAGNPDLQAEWQRIVQTGNADGFGNDPNAYYAQHWQQYGQSEGRGTTPFTASQPQPATPQVDPNAPPPTYYQETYEDRPDALAVPQYGAAPAVGSYIDPSKFTVDPGYQFRLKEGLSAVNAASAARGKLRSGDAAKALQDRGEGLANQGYNDWYQRQLQAYDRDYGSFADNRSYGTNLWNTQQNRQDNVFSEDRGFAANRNDQATSNLFGLAGIGQSAAAGTASAGNVFAQNQIASNNQRANTTANAAIANAGNMTNLFGSAANALGTYYGMQGGGGGSSFPRTYSI